VPPIVHGELDATLLRPGRLGDKTICFSIPDDETRTTILKMELETTILLDANSEGISWDCEVVVDGNDRSRAGGSTSRGQNASTIKKCILSQYNSIYIDPHICILRRTV
jgi:SpoVK/Ycf46/Vps4 family AAA+-type ATPase